MKLSEKIRTLIKYIGDKTDREIDKIEEETARKAKETEDEFKTRAEREYRETVENAKRYADGLIKRLVSQARTEVRKIDLEAKASFLESTIKRIKDEAKKLIDSPQYPNILKKLVAESIVTLDEREVVIKTSKQDREMILKITKEIKKEQEVLGGKFNKNNYISERIWAPARDGKKIPVSIVYHKNTKPSKNTPLLLYAYGSYGYTLEDKFSTNRLSLLDRGFIYAVPHIRGGQYLGRQWYEDGKLLKKKNTFTDYIDSAKYLIEKNYTSSRHLYAEGGSAGGLLMGAIVNMQGDLFNGVISAVPFVDIVTTMLDDSIPLTTSEYDEWGNPNKKEYYFYMKSYSPYDNVTAKEYPNMLITTGLYDSQVQYFEPAKWTAKLRELKTDNNILLLKTDMKVGHGGASGRFNALKDIAVDYAFLLDLEGVNK